MVRVKVMDVAVGSQLGAGDQPGWASSTSTPWSLPAPCPSLGEPTWSDVSKDSAAAAQGRRALDPITGCFSTITSFDLPHDIDTLGLVLEIKRWKSMRHPHLVRIFEYECTDRQLEVRRECMVLGSLPVFVAEFGSLDAPVLKSSARGVVEGLHYLHSSDPPLVHGSLRGANILFDEHLCVKIAGVGCSTLEAPVTWTTPKIPISMLAWSAPEIVQGLSSASVEADVWSLGCTLIEMVTATCPWGERRPLDVIFRILAGEHVPGSATPPVPHSMPQDVQDLTRRCLKRNPLQRSSTDELMALSSDFLHKRASVGHQQWGLW